MGKSTGIQWSDSTWNPWRGCQKVSEGCRHCYADTGSKRNPTVLGQWGTAAQGGTRVVASDNGPNGWTAPMKWQRSAVSVTPRLPWYVFPSWCDIFEDWRGPMHAHTGRQFYTLSGDRGWYQLVSQPGLSTLRFGNPVEGEPTVEVDESEARPVTMDDVRATFWRLVENTPDLTWLILTKRPENITRMVPKRWEAAAPANVWFGISAETQDTLAVRWHHFGKALDWLDTVPVAFLSAEPLLGELRLRAVPAPGGGLTCSLGGWYQEGGRRFDWVIAGGESGGQARECEVSWVRAIVKDCKDTGTPVFVKQLGSRPVVEEHKGTAELAREFFPGGVVPPNTSFSGVAHARYTLPISHPKGGDPEDWPDDLRVREMPTLKT